MTRTFFTEDAEAAAERLRAGGIVAFPTETVYGLGADIRNESAVARIFEAKGRPSDNPLIVHVADISEIGPLAGRMPAPATALIDAFFPGPLTVVVPRSDGVPDVVTAGLDTVGIRMPDHPVGRAFLRAAGRPVAAPSANRSGRPSPTTWQAVRDDLDGRVDAVLKGGDSPVGLESTVVDCTGDVPVVLRPGSITLEDLRLVVPGTRSAVTDGERTRSPGTRHRHYRPDATVVLVDDPEEAGLRARRQPEARAAYIGPTLTAAGTPFLLSLTPDDAADYARRLFAFFRECEHANVETVYCERMDEAGIGRALMDRLRRAAGTD